MEVKKSVLNQREVLTVLGIGKTTLWRMIKNGQFPQSFKLGRKLNGWRVTDVQAWLDSRQLAG